MAARVISINVSDRKGVRKKPVPHAVIRENTGIEGDAHASSEWHRQVSLLAIESIRKMQAAGLQVGPGDFAENLTTEGIDLLSLPVGTRIRIGGEVTGEVSQIGKVCHTRCAIYRQAGDCVMPKEGIFIRVLTGGAVSEGDEISVFGESDGKVLPGLFTAAVITLSDRGFRGERDDASGPLLAGMIGEIASVVHTETLPDEQNLISERLLHHAGKVDLIITTGGTGLSPRDVTPEATRAVLDREIPGIAEALRAEGLKKTKTAMLSRAVAGVCRGTLVVNLPGSPRAVKESIEVLRDALPHAIEKIRGSDRECARG